ncbi:GNAT family N-acetyltransferase [Dyadobacter psychrotolerans]|uniref:GNAT family N-acetyltransferase n=1 Tax=Dyadobacter psychrotolerans TaxID=2541721 RepID=UPI0035B5B8FC
MKLVLLLLESLKWLKSENCKETILTVNTKNKSAMKLYRKVGFSFSKFYYIDMNKTL